jgi:hypothetical protein
VSVPCIKVAVIETKCSQASVFRASLLSHSRSSSTAYVQLLELSNRFSSLVTCTINLDYTFERQTRH